MLKSIKAMIILHTRLCFMKGNKKLLFFNCHIKSVVLRPYESSIYSDMDLKIKVDTVFSGVIKH